MFKKSITAVFTVIFLVTAVFQSLGAEEITGRAIMEKAGNRFTGRDRVADMTMTLIKSSGRRRVRKDSFFVAKIDFYDRKGNFLKRLHSTDIKKIDGILTAMKMEMENVRKKQRTILEFENVKYNTGLKDSIFSERNLKREE